MGIQIPIVRDKDDVSAFTLQVPLDGITYTLSFRWNVRAQRTDADGNLVSGAWFMTVLDSEGVQPYMVGLQLVANFPIANNQLSRTPPGVFMVIDTGADSSAGIDPGYDDLGNRHKLQYYSPGEG